MRKSDKWEAFLNEDSLKSQLSSRYIYEHLFLTHLYFPGLDDLPVLPYRSLVDAAGQAYRLDRDAKTL